MNNIKDHENLNEKKVLLRLDLNVPLKDGIITDQTRIDKIIPIVEFLIKKNSKIIIISHVGRPKGKVDKNLSLKPICENLEKKIKKKIKIISKDIFKLQKKDLFQDTSEQLVLLENIRFYKEEETNDLNFSKHLAGLGDIFVNDAFSCSHRSHASVSKITRFLPSFAGLQLESEINALKKITTEIKKPITCIIGGSKISTKIGVIKNLIPKFDNMIIVGGMANNILNYQGKSIGKSIKEDNCEKIIHEIFETSKNHSCTITYPQDVSVGKNFYDNSKIKEIDKILDDDLILDIGPKTINKIKNIIENSETVLWNGPAGYFENVSFLNGTLSIAEAISHNTLNGYILVGRSTLLVCPYLFPLLRQLKSMKLSNHMIVIRVLVGNYT